MSFNIEAIRARFPSLNRRLSNGRLPVFLDNPAGTQVPQSVIDAISGYFVTMNANSGGAFATSQASDAMVHATREALALFLNAPRADEIVIGANMTTLNFALSRALGQRLSVGDEIILTRMDHDANVSPWLRLAEDRGLVVRWVDIKTDDCTLDMDSLEAALSERTKLVATVHASNAAGTINPIRQIADMVHAAGALHIVDAVQSAPHIRIDVQALGCDFLLCSAYKFFGPHAGVMWGRYGLLESLPAYKVRPSKNVPPYRWETGTPAFELIAGIGAAVQYIATLGGEDAFNGDVLERAYAVMMAYERELAAHLIDVLQRDADVQIAGITNPAQAHLRVPTVIFSHARKTPLEVASHFASRDIYVWDGNYYAVEIMDRLGRANEGMVRVGLAHYNTHDEIDQLAAALKTL
jgi:cysteine desulfurase family protein (TIGR01976 family)